MQEALDDLNPLWRDKETSVDTRIRLLKMCALSISIFLCQCGREMDLQENCLIKDQAFEMKYYRHLFAVK